MLAVAEAAEALRRPGSHPCAAVERALELKGIAYKRVDLLPLVHLRPAAARVRPADGARRSSSTTASGSSGSRLDHAAARGARARAAAAARRAPAQRARVEARRALGRRGPPADRAPHRCGRRSSAARTRWTSYAEGAGAARSRASLARRAARSIALLERRLQRRHRAARRADLPRCRATSTGSTAWIADGRRSAARQPNAADLQIGTACACSLPWRT